MPDLSGALRALRVRANRTESNAGAEKNNEKKQRGADLQEK
jgi:hypothetical protein